MKKQGASPAIWLWLVVLAATPGCTSYQLGFHVREEGSQLKRDLVWTPCPGRAAAPCDQAFKSAQGTHQTTEPIRILRASLASVEGESAEAKAERAAVYYDLAILLYATSGSTKSPEHAEALSCARRSNHLDRHEDRAWVAASLENGAGAHFRYFMLAGGRCGAPVDQAAMDLAGDAYFGTSQHKLSPQKVFPAHEPTE